MSSLGIKRLPNNPGVYRLTCTLQIERPIDEVFEFFSSARNLERITPHGMRFQVLTPEPITMQAGTLIDYRLKVHGVPLRWRSEITNWQPPHRFIDEQRKGPYRSWQHEHTFVEQDGGTLVRDQVDYSVPGGSLVHRFVVRPDLEAIFRFRTSKLVELLSDSAPSR